MIRQHNWRNRNVRKELKVLCHITAFLPESLYCIISILMMKLVALEFMYFFCICCIKSTSHTEADKAVWQHCITIWTKFLSLWLWGGEWETAAEQMQQIQAGSGQKSLCSGIRSWEGRQPHWPGAGGLCGWVDLQQRHLPIHHSHWSECVQDCEWALILLFLSLHSFLRLPPLPQSSFPISLVCLSSCTTSATFPACVCLLCASLWRV